MSTSAPLVSVVLPTWNRAHCIATAVTSVLTQSHEDLELIVVDDGSSDDTEQVLARMGDPRLVYHRRARNGGVSAARNTGLALARGIWVAFQDSDDEWAQGKLQTQVEHLHRSPSDTISVGTVLRKLGTSVRRWPPVGPADADAGWLLDGAVGYCQALLAPRDLLLSVGGFDEALPMWEDWDLLLRLSQRAALRRCEGSWVLSIRQDDSLTNDRSRFAEFQGRVIDRHLDLLARSPVQLARLEYAVGRYALEAGAVGEARHRFARAVRRDPLQLRYWAYLLAARHPRLGVSRESPES